MKTEIENSVDLCTLPLQKLLDHDPMRMADLLFHAATQGIPEAQATNGENSLMLETAVAIIEQICGQDTPRLLSPLYELAAVYAPLDRHAESEKIYRRLLTLLATHGSNDDVNEAKVRTDLGDSLRQLERPLEAEAELRAACGCWSKRFNGTSDVGDIVTTLEVLGELMRESGQEANAERSFEDARKIRKGLARGDGDYHRKVSAYLWNEGQAAAKCMEIYPL